MDRWASIWEWLRILDDLVHQEHRRLLEILFRLSDPALLDRQRKTTCASVLIAKTNFARVRARLKSKFLLSRFADMWVFSSKCYCGHLTIIWQVYCGECARNRHKTKRHGKAPAHLKPPFDRCVVLDCAKSVKTPSSMIQIFL